MTEHNVDIAAWSGESYYAANGWSGCDGAHWRNLVPATRDGWEAAAKEANRVAACEALIPQWIANRNSLRRRSPGTTHPESMDRREANTWDVAAEQLTVATASSRPPGPHDLSGHPESVLPPSAVQSEPLRGPGTHLPPAPQNGDDRG